MISSFTRRAVTTLLLLLGSMSCASERAPINRVQANALKKSFFVGASLSDQSDNPEFYYRPTIVDVDYGASQDGLFTASGQTMARVKFEITEDLLVARLTYERIADSTLNGTPASPDQNSGQIVAAFKIESQFDIKRAYNPTTGEELNIVEENTTDSPWYSREYMRVDWSQNLITSAYQLDTLAALKSFEPDAFVYEPVAYSVTDPHDPDAPIFDEETGYFDITNKVFVTPQTLDTPFGPFPACYLSPDFFGGSAPVGNCNPTEVKVRLSFRPVGGTDYEPIHWDGARMNMFGMFTTGELNPDRLGYDRNYGVVDDKWYRFVSRHNLWQQSHARDGAGKLIPCYTEATTPVGAEPSRDVIAADGSASPDGTDDECETAGAGSRCDRFSHACTLPYAKRQTKLIPFYYGPESDPTLFDSTAQALAQWDGALRQTVQTARYTECIRISGGVQRAVVDACKQQYDPSFDAALTQVPTIFTLCHNPVIVGDDPGCGPATTLARIGDLRYNMIDVIQKPQTGSPWGILADASDPITGEVVAASVNVWNAVTDVAAQTTVDTMRWYTGELSNADVSNADYLKPLVSSDARSPQFGSSTPPQLSASEAAARVASLDTRLNDGTKYSAPAGLSGQALADWAESQVRAKYGDQALGSGNAPINARMTAMLGSPGETQLITAPYLRLAGVDPTVPVNDTARNVASPLRGNFAQFLWDFERQRQARLASIGTCIEEAPEPTSVVDWATIMQQKFPLTDEDPNTPGVQAGTSQIQTRNDKWHDFIRRRLNFGVLLHELGHSMGLRHQFTSSFDALNYEPQYWQLRTRNGVETAACTAPTTDGTTCIGPRWNDPITQGERDGLLYRWQHTSVMDYPGDLTQDTLGIGAYDRAAMRLEYADVADVWDDTTVSCRGSGTGTPACSNRGQILHGLLDGFGGLTGPIYQDTRPFHYSQLGSKLGLIKNCRPADTNPPAGWDESLNGVYSPVFDGKIVAGSVCDGIPTDYVPYRELLPDSGVFTQEPGIGDEVQRNFDQLGRVRRPYMFGSDEFADIGNVPVLRHDNGADAYEISHFLISDYEDRHLFESYRRNRTTFNLRGAFMRGFNRDNSKLMEITKSFALLNELYQGVGFDSFVQDEGQLKPGALAATLVFDHFARILTRPSSGAHFGDTALDPAGSLVLRSTDQLPTVATKSPINLLVPDGSTGIGVDVSWGGRPLHNALDNTKGYYATQYDLWVGSYYDKTIAMDLMTDSIDRFISEARDDFNDGRYRNTSFATMFPDGMRRLLASTLTEDHDITGWRAAATKGIPDADKQGSPTRALGFRAWWSKGSPSVCWPTNGQILCQQYPGDASVTAAPGVPSDSVALDPEVGFEVQKFITFFSMLNLPETWKLNFVDMMRIWQVGSDPAPGFADAETIAWRDPQSGQLYLAHSYGTEVIDGKTVQRGIAARVIEWMNTLTAKGYTIDTTVANPTGELTVKRYTDNTACPSGVETCVGQAIQADSAFAIRVTNYKSVLDYMHLAASQFGFYGPYWRGLY